MTGHQIIEICSSCNHPLGSNPKCEACLWANAKQQADSVEQDQAGSVLDSILAWLESHAGVGAEHFFKQVKLLYELCRDWYDGKYTGPTWQTIATILGALLYVVMPIDLIPDWIVIIGWTDDAAVVAATIRKIRNELMDYLNFRGESASDYGLD